MLLPATLLALALDARAHGSTARAPTMRRGLALATAPPMPSPERFSVAPMMDYTDRHFRYFFRLLSRRAVLYTEMVVANSIVYNPDNVERWLGCVDGAEFGAPRDVLQLGGSAAEPLKTASRRALEFPYSAVNLNCGCPSERVAGSGAFGASLMREPEHVASLCAAMLEGTRGELPVTVKCRIGVDDDDSYEALRRFVDVVSGAGVQHFVVHARKAILNMHLTPHQNRNVPPLRPEMVYALADEFEPARVRFTLNGGIVSVAQARECLERAPRLAGVMVGRDVTNRPFHWAHSERALYGGGAAHAAPTRGEVLAAYAAYARRELRERGARESALIKPLHNLFHGAPGARGFRRALAQLTAEHGAGAAVDGIEAAAEGAVPIDVLNEPADERARDAPERDYAESARGASAQDAEPALMRTGHH